MFTILLHSSKSMRAAAETMSRRRPTFINEAEELVSYLRSLSVNELSQVMKISKTKADEVDLLFSKWNERTKANDQPAAIDAFIGDIYSGLQVQSFSSSDRTFADKHLIILSGLYGGLRPFDGVSPYRLEMGYKLEDEQYQNLYKFWGNKIAELIPASDTVINLSAVEYTKSVLPHISNVVITPKFLTVHKETKEPTFVTVHTKIARGAFARYLIQERTLDNITKFSDLGYHYDAKSSSKNEPVFICDTFEGLGLSVRLS